MIFEKVVEKGSKDQMDYILETGVFVFFPFVNIDGYYAVLSSPTKKTILRKNMNPG